MEHTVTALVAGVRFSRVGKVYHFDATRVGDLQVGDQVVVETSRGWQLGSVATVLQDVNTPSEGLKAIDRRATPRDLVMKQSWQTKESDVIEACKARASELNLHGIKIVGAEYSFDGSRLAVLFSSESEEKFDLKSLRQDMQRSFGPAQVEMRQIGPRDVAKMMCGMGACGLETRCCSQFLCEFSSISIRMAKEQGISLTPSEITGMCGRLRCCLIYEYDQYVQARALLPKRNKRVATPQGEGKVYDVVPLRDSVIVEFMDQPRREYRREEIQVLEDGAPAPVMIKPPPDEENDQPKPEADFHPGPPRPQRRPEGRPQGQGPRQGHGKNPQQPHDNKGKGGFRDQRQPGKKPDDDSSEESRNKGSR